MGTFTDSRCSTTDIHLKVGGESAVLEQEAPGISRDLKKKWRSAGKR